MVGDALLSELERQEKYLAQLPENYEFPLFNARQAVESQRRSGYKDTAAASREIVDNAIEAGADPRRRGVRHREGEEQQALGDRGRVHR